MVSRMVSRSLRSEWCMARDDRGKKGGNYNLLMNYKKKFLLLGVLFGLALPVYAARICKDYASRIPGLTEAECEAAQLRDMQARSVLGRTLWGTDLPATHEDLRVLVIGAIHGDEMSSGGVVYHWLELAREPLPDYPLGISWRFIPVVNPDGLFAKPASRTNARGVDLNRNFPTPNWAADAKAYWEKRTKRDKRRWPGDKAASEPETQFVLEQMESFAPHLIVSVHAPYAVLDFDGPFVPPDRLGRLYLDQLGIFPGSLGNYGGIHRHTPVVTIELASAVHEPSPAETRQMWLDLLRWINEKMRP